jgi:hypothetical protein
MSDQRHQGHYDIVEDFWRLLQAADVDRVRTARRRAVRRRQVRTLVLAVLLVLALAAVALAVKALVFGADAPTTFNSSQRAGIGAIGPGTVRLLSVRTDDPQGGPPWAMRVFSTRRGYGCYQVGRLVDGRLAALGINGAFSSDGRAHRLPIDRHGCGGTDDVGHLRFTAVSPVRDASAALTDDRCFDPERVRAARFGVRNAQGYIASARRRGDDRAVREGRRQLRRARHEQAGVRPCPPKSLRVVIAGTAGPSATAVELTADTRRMTERVRAADGGAFLFVLMKAELPTSTTLEATYPGGRRCTLPDPVASPHATRAQPGCEPLPGFVYKSKKRVR